jgi:hypothetical protein
MMSGATSRRQAVERRNFSGDVRRNEMFARHVLSKYQLLIGVKSNIAVGVHQQADAQL